MKKSDLIKVLVGIGISKANAEKMAAETPDASTTVFEDKDITALVTDFKTNQTELFKNDPEFISEIQKKEYSKNKDIFIRKLKQNFDLTADEIKSVTKKKNDGGVEIEIIDTDALIELASKKAGANKDKAAADLQQELLTANQKIKNLEEVEIPKIKSTVEQERKTGKIQTAIEKFVSEHGDKLRVKTNAAMPSLLANLQAKGYEADLDDEGKLVFKKAGLAIRNKTNTGLLTAKEIINEDLEELEFIKKSNADDKKPDVVIVEKDDDNNGPKQKNKITNANLLKAQKHAESLKTPTT